MPINSQERASIVRSAKDQVLAELAKDKKSAEATGVEHWFLTWLKTWSSILSLAAITIGVVYWQFIFDLKTTVDKFVANNATVVTLNAKVNGTAGQPGISDRLAKIEGSVKHVRICIAFLKNSCVTLANYHKRNLKPTFLIFLR